MCVLNTRSIFPFRQNLAQKNLDFIQLHPTVTSQQVRSQFAFKQTSQSGTNIPKHGCGLPKMEGRRKTPRFGLIRGFDPGWVKVTVAQVAEPC